MNARVLIVEDQTMFLQLLSGMLRSQPGIDLIATGTTVSEGCKAVEIHHDLHLLVLDLDLPDGKGTKVLRHALKHHPKLECIILSGHAGQFLSPPDLRKSIRAVIDKTEAYDHLQLALQEITVIQENNSRSQPDPRNILTPRQLEIFRLIGLGMISKEIASQLFISVHTVETHRKSITRQLRASGPDLVRMAGVFNQTSLVPLP